jgi:ferredoxin
MQVLFNIIRQTENSAPNVQTYQLDVNPGSTILDCLNQIKWEQDGSLAFRKNCRNTICGSCAMRINGRSVLACKENVSSELERLNHIAETTKAVENGQASEPPTITILKRLIPISALNHARFPSENFCKHRRSAIASTKPETASSAEPATPNAMLVKLTQTLSVPTPLPKRIAWLQIPGITS